MGWKYPDILPLLALIDLAAFAAVTWIYFKHGRSEKDIRDNYFFLWGILVLNIAGLGWALIEGGATCRAHSAFAC